MPSFSKQIPRKPLALIQHFMPNDRSWDAGIGECTLYLTLYSNED